MAKKTETRDTAPATSDAYTGMLAISLLALLVGIALLWLDYSQYPDSKGPTVPKYAPPAAAAPAEGKAPAAPPGNPAENAPMAPMPEQK